MRGPAGWPPLTQNFGYADPANRLLTASEAGGWAQTYGYDAFGNRTVVPNASGAPIYAPNSGYTPVQGQSLVANQFTTHNQWVRGASANCASVPSPTAGDQYDCAGNQTALAQAGTSSQYNTPASTFSYDGENRLLVAAIGNQGGASFVYDGEGRRVQKITPSATTTYIHDAKGELAMEVSTAAPTASGTEYLTADTLGSTRLITDGSGNPQRCIDYLPFGEEIPVGMNGRTGPCYETLGSGGLSPTGPEYPAADDVADQKFTGKERDAETGLDYFDARYFSAAQGRFTSPDWSAAPEAVPYASLEDPQTLNLYAYVRNNPLGRADADGHCCSWDDLKAAASDAWDAGSGAVRGVSSSLTGGLVGGPRSTDSTLSRAGQALGTTAVGVLGAAVAAHGVGTGGAALVLAPETGGASLAAIPQAAAETAVGGLIIAGVAKNNQALLNTPMRSEDRRATSTEKKTMEGSQDQLKDVSKAQADARKGKGPDINDVKKSEQRVDNANKKIKTLGDATEAQQ